jgi:signal peptidase I
LQIFNQTRISLKTLTSETNMKLSNYNGPSMNPTFWPGDGLRVVPYGGKRIRRGDVVAFPDPNGMRNVVHRVIKVNTDGIRTRGDNSNSPDPWVLKPEDITGRVVSVHKRNKSYIVAGGKKGMILGIILTVKNGLKTRLFQILHPVYRWSARTGLFQALFSPLIRPQILYFKHPRGTELHIVLGPWVIGRRLQGANEWQIKRPFRLFVDVEKLKF